MRNLLALSTAPLPAPLILTASLLASASLLAACGGASPRERGREPAADGTAGLFEDASEAAGLDFVHDNGATGALYFVEIAGAGGGFLDFDGDGDLDLWTVQGGPLDPRAAEPAAQDRLYRNDLDPGAEDLPALRLVDVTAEAGIGLATYGMGIATGDVDNDGRTDVYRTAFGPDRLLRNRGDGTFVDVSAAAGVGDAGWSVSAAFLDFDRDGWLDLFVVRYVDFRLTANKPCFSPSGRPDYCGPLAYEPVADLLLRNRGDGTFEDVSRKAGIAALPGNGLGVVAADFDGDGWTDLYAANDQMPNVLWRNRGDGTFTDEAALAGCAVNADGQPEASMGVEVADLDGDGALDLFLTHLDRESSTLYLGDGRGLFEDRSRSAGLGLATRGTTGFGAVLADFDNDGDLDAASANGAVHVQEALARAGDPFPFGQPNLLLLNDGKGVLLPAAAPGASFGLPETGRGLAAGDVDNDGDPDLLLFNDGGRARLLLNREGQDRPWIGLALVDTRGRHPEGALISIDAGSRRIVRLARTAGSYASAHDPRVLVGLGEHRGPVSAMVRWPDGTEETWPHLEAGRYHTLRQRSAPREEPDAP